MIHVIALITTQPGKRSQVLELFRANCPAVLAEAGCIEYGATIDAQNLPAGRDRFGKDTFVVIEKWESMAHLQAHSVAPHMTAYGAATRPMVENRAVHVLEAI
jgi:quinol monooxygenase YgiN